MEKFRVMSKAEILAWMADKSTGFTNTDLAVMTGLPRNTIVWMQRSGESRMSAARQMYLSKIIADIEHGYLKIEQGRKGGVKGGRKGGSTPNRAIRLEKPEPLPPKYSIEMTPKGPRLVFKAKPPLIRALPSFKGIRLSKS